jgi:hypothetical protein
MASVTRAALVGVLVVAIARAALAQNAPPAPADEPAANPGRPTVSTPATLTPVGYLQLENGVLVGHRSEDFATLLGLNQVTKLAVHPRVQLIAQFQPVAWSEGEGESRFTTYAGGISAGAQVLLYSGKGATPSIAAGFLQTAYAGDAPDLDIGSSRQSYLALFSFDFGAFHADTNTIVNNQADSSRHLQYGQTLSIAHPLKKTILVCELWRFTQPLDDARAGGLLWALSFGPSPRLIYDVGVDLGLTTTSTHWEVFGGFTYLMPHKLWR